MDEKDVVAASVDARETSENKRIKCFLFGRSAKTMLQQSKNCAKL